MTAPVIELLGAMLRFQPDLFAAHMQHYGDTWRTAIDGAGNPLEGPVISSSNRGPPWPMSRFRHQPFFSFPFRRKLRHQVGEGINHAAKRTMFRDHNDFENTVEERISGAFSVPLGTTSAIGILLFDSFDTRNTFEPDEDTWLYRYSQDIPVFNSEKPRSAKNMIGSQSSRDSFIRQFESGEFLHHVLQEDSTMTCAILGIIGCEWVSVIDKFELILREEPTVISSTNDYGDFQLDVITKQTKYLRENREMLRGCLAAIQAGTKTCCVAGMNHAIAERLIDLEIDFKDLIQRTEDHIIRVGRGLAVFASITAIEESRKAIRQAEDIRALTGLATFYIPLSFVASILGMNVSQISQNLDAIWIYFAIAVPLTVLSFFIVGKWVFLVKAWSYLFKKDNYDYSGTRLQRRKTLV